MNQAVPQNSTVVAKFGGTSVADFEAMNRSADVVLANPQVRLVVLSASAGVTNLLVALAEGCEAEKRNYQLDEIRRIQYAILDRLAAPAVIRDEIDRLLENIAMLSEAASLATSTALTDELVSHGELMSTLLFVEILRARNVQAEWFDVRKVMRTDDHFGRAVPDSTALSELAQAQLRPRLQEALVVTQGFIGSEPKGRTTTLGRGGSDYTAALLGEALGVGRVDIWTDVPGIYTTDPRVVPAAKRIDKIGFEEAAEMATFGAKVLHPATLLPAVRSDIPVFVGSSKDPAAGGTLVCNTTENPPLFRALALRLAPNRHCQADPRAGALLRRGGVDVLVSPRPARPRGRCRWRPAPPGGSPTGRPGPTGSDASPPARSSPAARTAAASRSPP